MPSAHEWRAIRRTCREKYHFDQFRVEAMRAYARLRTCRRQYLLEHFGEKLEPPCSGCDNCDQPLVNAEHRPPA